MTAEIGASTEPTLTRAGLPIGTEAVAGSTVIGGGVGVGPTGPGLAGEGDADDDGDGDGEGVAEGIAAG